MTVENASGVVNTGGTENGEVGGKKGYIYSSSCDLISCILLVNDHKTAQPSSYTTTRHCMNEEPRDEI